jgi:hypothetical protein
MLACHISHSDFLDCLAKQINQTNDHFQRLDGWYGSGVPGRIGGSSVSDTA